MKKYLIIAAVLLAACTREDPAPDPELVVEAWIESDGEPVVMVTTSVTPTREPQQLSSLSSHVEKYAKVTLDDGEKRVILTGFISNRFYPPYYYTTGRIKGEVGKTYTLTVESKGRKAQSSVTVPEPLKLKGLEYVPYGDNGDLFLLKAKYTGNTHCKFFTKIEGVDKEYVPALTGLATTDGVNEVTIRPGNTLNRTEKRPAFKSGETVWIKCCTMDDGMYALWKTLDDLIYLDTTAFFTLDTNLPGNVDGAIGYFAGYGKTEYIINLPQPQP